MNTIAENARQQFAENFSGTPRLFFSPGRINLIGEHVDYNDGFVMPAAINKGVYYALAPNGTTTLNFIAMDFQERASFDLKDVAGSEGWKNYVLSVVNEFLLLKKNIGGFDCVFSGDIPRGSGMSSSAAVEGGLAYGINEMFNLGLDRVTLALLCQRAEHNFPNVKCGIMDQFANMMGKNGHVILLDCQSIKHQYFPLKLDGYKIVLINTNVHHSLASGEYNIRRQRCEEGMSILKKRLSIHSFRELKESDVRDARDEMSEKVFNCCLFVVQEIERTQKAAILLQSNDVQAFGKLMFEAHEGLSKLYEVSCKELDHLVEMATKFDAVIGARMMGGGFGGCTINLVKNEGIESFVNAVTLDYQQKFHIIPEAYIVETGDGTHELS
ncbi:MAG: galactokinase [Ferruginibacter sp.]|nr:galactokinase [Ferruginibacter sp.]